MIARDAFNGTVLWKKKFKSWITQLMNYKSGPTQSTRRVVFDTSNNSYRVEKYDSGASAWVLEYNPSAGVTNNQQNYEIDFDDDSRFRGIEISAASFNGSSTVEFDDLGNPSSGGTVRLKFEEHEYEIRVAPFTGRVTVERVTS